MFATHSFDTGEVTLSYAEGPESGPPLLVLHGVNGRWQAHEPVMRALGNRWHIYACDLRGHGESGRAPQHGGYLMQDYMRDVTAFVREVVPGDEPIALMGFSLGAMIALGTAVALPNRVQKLVLVEPALMLRNHRFQDLPIANLLTVVYETTRRRPSFEEMVDTCRAIMPDADEAIIMAVATQLSKIDPEVTNPDVLDRGLEGVDLEAMLASLRCPVLIIHGEPTLGSLMVEDDVAWVRQHAPRAEIIPVDGAGHDIPMDIVLERGRRFLEPLQ